MLLASPVMRLLCCGVVFMASATVAAQNFPNRPVRIVTSGVGGGTDFVARLIAHGLTENLGQRVIVENRASGVIPGEIVFKATPDGHTLLLATGILWLLPLLQDKVPYDPVRDFAPVTLAANSPNIVTVTLLLPAKSVKELIALAKARPGTLNYAITANAGGAHLAGELFMAMAGIKMLRVPYKSGGTAVTELIAGQVQVYFVSAGSVVPHIKAGRLRGLAVTSARRSEVFPELPPVAETLPGYELQTGYGIYAPARTPEALISRLQKEILRAINMPDIKVKFLNSAVEPVGSSPAQLHELRASELARMGRIIKEAGIRGE